MRRIAARRAYDACPPAHPPTRPPARYYSVPDARPPRQGKAPRWENRIHWHVYDFTVLQQMMECTGLNVELTALLHPYHMVLVGRKPPMVLLEEFPRGPLPPSLTPPL